MLKKWSVRYPAVNGWERRDVYLYLPTMYFEEPERRFPVLYMFDGQNLFLDEEASFGKSWGMEAYLDAHDVPLIVAGLASNSGENNERLLEYSPYRFDDPEFGPMEGCGKATLDWYTRRFKPFIDRNFRTIPEREYTFLGGSSMGGLMSLYGLLRYNRTYSRAAALSPSLWVAPDALRALTGSSRLNGGEVMYMDYGSREEGTEANMLPLFTDIASRLLKREIALTLRLVPNGEHSEASWERQLPFLIETLLFGLEL